MKIRECECKVVTIGKSKLSLEHLSGLKINTPTLDVPSSKQESGWNMRQTLWLCRT